VNSRPAPILLAGLGFVALMVVGGIVVILVLRTPAGVKPPPPPSSPPPGNAGLKVTVIQSGLSVPWDLAFAPDGKMLVTERRGRLRIYASAEKDAELLQEIDIPDVLSVGESGAMGIAIDVDFADHPYIYICASRDPDGEDRPAPWVNQLIRYEVDADWHLTFDGPLFDDPVPRAFRQHDGCAVQMDDTRHIWMSMGDTLKGAKGWPQDPARLNGKILRINADGSVPDDNPVWPGADGPSYVYTIGHRNPQGIAFQPGTGEVYASEHGTMVDDEINHIVAGTNYGWACYLDTDEPGIAPREDCPPPDQFTPPAWASGAPTLATSGCVFLEGSQWGDWEGSLIVSTLKQQDLRRFVFNEDGTAHEADILLDGQFGRLRGVVLGPDGALYVSTSNLSNASKEGHTPQPEVFADVIVRVERTSS
jgi:glucose/arabinose dehydrogenase